MSPGRSRWLGASSKKHVESTVAGFRERVWMGRVDRLLREETDRIVVVCCQCVVRQMRMEVERRDAFEPPAGVETVGLDKRLELHGARDGCRSQSPAVLDGNVKALHKRARVFAETLLARERDRRDAHTPWRVV